MSSINKILNKALSKKSSHSTSSPKNKNNFIKIIKNDNTILKKDNNSYIKNIKEADNKKDLELRPSTNTSNDTTNHIKLGQKVLKKYKPNFKKINCSMHWCPFIEPCNLYEPRYLDKFNNKYYPNIHNIEDQYILSLLTFNIRIKKIGYNKKSKK